MNYFIVKDTTDPDKYARIGASGFMPPGVICQAPSGESIDWLDIVDDDSVGRKYDKKAVVNQGRKTSSLAQKATDKQAEKDDRAAKKALKQAVKQLKKADLADPDVLKQALIDIIELVG